MNSSRDHEPAWESPTPDDADYFGFSNDWSSSDTAESATPVGNVFGLTAIADLPEITLKPEDRHWWDAVLAEHVAIIAGPPGIGKTTLVRNIVRAVSKGEEFLGWPGPAGGVPVAIVDLETPGIDRKPRWRAVYGDELDGTRNVLVSTKTGFLNEIDLRGFIAELKSHGIKLLVVDTMARAFSVESENNNAEMTRMIALLKRIADAGPSVLVVGHFGKTHVSGVRALRELRRSLRLSISSSGFGERRIPQIGKASKVMPAPGRMRKKSTTRTCRMCSRSSKTARRRSRSFAYFGAEISISG